MNQHNYFINFEEKIKEVEILYNYAKANTHNIEKYGTFNKAGLVLLLAKFESFMEDFLEEYANQYLARVTISDINSNLKKHLTNILISDIDKFQNKPTKKSEALEKLEIFFTNNTQNLDNYEFNNSFNYGKHGEKELKKLLLRFGFEDFIEHIENNTTHDFFGNFNSMNNIRNNILHQDETPNLTHQQIKNYLDLIINFAKQLNMNAYEKVYGTSI